MEVLWRSTAAVAQNLALDDAAARSAASGNRSELHFWWGGPPAVVMGANERAADVAYTDACAELKIPLLKRSTGGGAVLQTSGVLNYSLITPAPRSLDVRAAFRPSLDLVCAILDSFGVAGEPKGASDVAVGGRKISGNAQARRWKALLVHGTLLVDFDFDLADRVLKYPAREPAYRGGRSHRDFLVTLRSLKVNADRRSLEQAAVDASYRLFRRIQETTERRG